MQCKHHYQRRPDNLICGFKFRGSCKRQCRLDSMSGLASIRAGPKTKSVSQHLPADFWLHVEADGACNVPRNLELPPESNHWPQRLLALPDLDISPRPARSLAQSLQPQALHGCSRPWVDGLRDHAAGLRFQIAAHSDANASGTQSASLALSSMSRRNNCEQSQAMSEKAATLWIEAANYRKHDTPSSLRNRSLEAVWNVDM